MMSLFRLTWALGYKIMMRHSAGTVSGCCSLVYKALHQTLMLLCYPGRVYDVTLWQRLYKKKAICVLFVCFVLVVLLVTSEMMPQWLFLMIALPT